MGPAKKKSAAASDAAVTEKKVRENFFVLTKNLGLLKNNFVALQRTQCERELHELGLHLLKIKEQDFNKNVT